MVRAYPWVLDFGPQFLPRRAQDRGRKAQELVKGFDILDDMWEPLGVGGVAVEGLTGRGTRGAGRDMGHGLQCLTPVCIVYGP